MIFRPQLGGQRSWTLSILLHLFIVGAIFGLWYWAAHKPKPVESLGIEARVVSGDALKPTIAPPPEPAPDPVPAPEAPPDPAPVAPGPTPEEIAAKAADEKAAEEKRVVEERRLAAEREVAERKAADEKADHERKEKERKDKEKADREKAARDKAEKDKADQAERERVAREQAEKDKAEQARQQRENELSAQLAAEDRRAAARNGALMNQYVSQITARLERAWIKPLGAVAGIDCEVRITQVPGGAVTGVKVGRCNGDESVRQSIEAAAYRASPLPEPSDPALFERDLAVRFHPN